MDAKTNLERRHLREAKAREALIFDIGDATDAMQSRNDPRRSKAELKARLKRPDYLNGLTNDSYKMYKNYSKNWVLMSQGNHEYSVLNYAGYDLVGTLAEKLNDKTGSNIYAGGYEGWVKFMFDMDGSQRQSINLFYTHGAGGAAPVTKGVIKTNRRGVYLPDAHIVASGHSHHAWAVWTGRLRLSRNGIQTEDKQLHIQIPGYKGRGNFEKRKEHAPKPCGAYWLNFRRTSHEITYRAIWV